MPGVDGFGLIERMHRAFLPAVIFVTAHDEHAIRAFRVGAFDYLLKPFDDATLRSSVERVRTFVRLARGGKLVAAAGEPTVEAESPGERVESRTARSREPLVIRTDGRVIVLHGADIDWVEAVGDRVRLHTARETYLLRATMRAIEGRLDPARFVRIHRGAIVALPLIRELQPYSRGEHVVVLADGTKLPLSRRHRPRLLRALGPPA